jgi:hypothetical protein
VTGLVIAAIVIAGVGAYLFIGWRCIAPGWVTREVARQVRQFSVLAANEAETWRREAAATSIAIGLVWPLYLAFRLLTGKIADRAPLTDFEARQQLADRDRRIAQLERELGVKS